VSFAILLWVLSEKIDEPQMKADERRSKLRSSAFICGYLLSEREFSETEKSQSAGAARARGAEGCGF
jgi:hypothetical protein